MEYREHALSLGVANEAILVEWDATNTGENIVFARNLLAERGIEIKNLLLISMPYLERRAYATCAKQWPGVSVLCASEPVTLMEYVQSLRKAT